MGAVYEAEHVGLGKRARHQVRRREFATDEKVVARFAREARAMSAIESAHIVTVFDAGTDDGRPYLVMELLRGEDLGQRFAAWTRIPLGEAMHIIAQVLRGLARAHAAGIVHRDLKPDNVFLVKHDTDPLFAKIVDFGISKIERPRDTTSPLALTGRGTVLGTPFYMSPEQAQASADVDGRTDLYSVGAILFECLTGRPPHTGESYEQVILSICMRDAPEVRSIEPSVPAPVSAFVARALARDRTKRFVFGGGDARGAPRGRARGAHTCAARSRASGAGDARVAAGGSARRDHARRRVARAIVAAVVPEESGVSAATRLGVGSLEPSTAGSAALATIAVKAPAKAEAGDAKADAARPRRRSRRRRGERREGGRLGAATEAPSGPAARARARRRRRRRRPSGPSGSRS